MDATGDTKELPVLPLSQFSQSLADKMVGKVDALCTKVDAMSALIGANNSKLDAQNKLAEVQTLQWAIQALAQVLAADALKPHSAPSANPSIGSFEYYLGTQRTISTSLAMEILFLFMQGLGRWITNSGFVETPDVYGRIKQDEAGRAAFRTKLSAQIHSLTGRKPRLAKEMNGKEEQWAIYSV